MAKTPQVSVIIPNYNHAPYLDQRIQSVLNQTYKDFELIILDDHSIDNSVEVIRKYSHDSHVSQIIVNEENSGSTFIQWYKGFELAKGEWIWIAESDDYCDMDMLACLVANAQKYKNIAVSYCRSWHVDSEGNIIKQMDDSHEIEYMQGLDFIKERMSIGCPIENASAVIFRKEYALKADKQYMDYVAAGDRLFWIELAEMGDVVIDYTPKNYFRQHLNKVSPQKRRMGITSREDFKTVRYLERKKLIGLFKGPYVRAFYLRGVDKIKYDNESTNKELKQLWCYNGWIPPKLLDFYGKVYAYMCYHTERFCKNVKNCLCCLK